MAQAPKLMAETFMSVRPSCRYSMSPRLPAADCSPRRGAKESRQPGARGNRRCMSSRRALRPALAACLLSLPGGTLAAQERAPVVLNDDAGWCWFQDERALVVGGRLVFGSVAAGRADAARRGAVEATSVELKTGAATRFRLSASPVERAGRYDDHDAPAFVVRGDGRILAAWAGHGFDDRILSRVTLEPGDATRWSEERVFVPSPSSKVSYTNLYRLAAEHGRIYDFFRGLDDRFKPSVAWSDDGGERFTSGNVVIDVPAAFRHRPYVKYASDGRAPSTSRTPRATRATSTTASTTSTTGTGSSIAPTAA